jgi:DNA-binding transcriptional MerR regulator
MVYPAFPHPMPSPYTIEQTAEASGLSVKFIRRLKNALPEFFEKHTERGQSNALLFDEEILEVLKRTKDLKNRGRTLQQIRDELAMVAAKRTLEIERPPAATTGGTSVSGVQTEEEMAHHQPARPAAASSSSDGIKQSLTRENELLRSQLDLLQMLLRKAEERFDRLLPEATQEKKQSLKSQLLMWIVEAVVVTVFAAGFIFMIWLFAQKAFTL